MPTADQRIGDGLELARLVQSLDLGNHGSHLVRML